MLSLPAPVDLSCYIQFVLAAAILYINRIFFKKGVMGIINRAPGMDTLISIGAAAAFLYSTSLIIKNIITTKQFLFEKILSMNNSGSMGHTMYFFESAGMIFTLITLGKMLEANSKAHTMDAINALSKLSLGKVTVLRDGEERTILSEAVRVGDLVYIREGDKIPADGTVTEGFGAVNKAALTGESVPEEVTGSDKVMAGSICVSGFFKFTVDKAGEDTTLSSIIRLVKEAAVKKAPVQLLADRIAGFFVPIVSGISLITFIVWLCMGYPMSDAINFAISVLVISCPCALGLATPAAVMAATGNAAGNNVLIRSSECLETANLIDTVVIDKTGTLTTGIISVTDADACDGTDINEAMLKTLSLEAGSSHPYAEAVRSYALEKFGISKADKTADDIETIPGRGIKGIIDGAEYIIGNQKFLEEKKIEIPADRLEAAEAMMHEGKTVLFMGSSKCELILGLKDTVKPDSLNAIEHFKKIGITPILATGDSDVTAKVMAEELGISEYYGGILPADKHDIIDKLQSEGRKVAMIGDGINDAPALVKADLGIAIGRGSDIAIDSADVILMKDSLSDAAYVIELGKRTLKVIKENLFWAFFYNVIGIPIAAGALFIPFGVKLSPAIAAACMSLSSLFVVTNALRLRKRSL